MERNKLEATHAEKEARTVEGDRGALRVTADGEGARGAPAATGGAAAGDAAAPAPAESGAGAAGEGATGGVATHTADSDPEAAVSTEITGDTRDAAAAPRGATPGDAEPLFKQKSLVS